MCRIEVGNMEARNRREGNLCIPKLESCRIAREEDDITILRH